MALSGDWVTPRLWGAPWYEKPALLYWMIGGAFRTGLSPDAAPRFAIALCGFTFLLFYYLWLTREFGQFTGAAATGLLATCALWVGFSHAAVTDLPMAATFAAATLLVLPMLDGRPARVATAAVLLGLSVLAKGLVPLVLAIPFVWFARRRWREWLSASPVLAFIAVAAPWYVLCYARNGPEFIDVFFLRHTFGRFTSPDLQHEQPVWFYVPVLLAAVFPSTLLFAFVFRRALYRDVRMRFLAAIVVFGFLFFSASRNKLPGYMLPLLPAACVIAAAGLDAARRDSPAAVRRALAISSLALPLFALTAGLLPAALAGAKNLLPIDHTTAVRTAVTVPLIVLFAAAAFFLKPPRALALWCILAACGWLYVEYAALPWVDRAASARSVWRELPEPKRGFCVGPVSRNWRYGLNYYSAIPLSDCPPGAVHSAILPGPTSSSRPVMR